ncbi:MAG: creatininase family protein, partial [Caldimonas sp.]
MRNRADCAARRPNAAGRSCRLERVFTVLTHGQAICTLPSHRPATGTFPQGERVKRYWADYTCPDFAALDRSRLIAVLPVSAIEQHGPHLPFSVDTTIVEGIIDRVIERLSDELPVLFLPTQRIGKSNE